MEWFLYDNGLCHERVKKNQNKLLGMNAKLSVIQQFSKKCEIIHVINKCHGKISGDAEDD